MTEKPHSVLHLEKHPEATLRLLSLGVCQRCLLRIAGETRPSNLRNALSLLDKGSSPAVPAKTECGNGEPVLKEKTVADVCPCCFGLLQEQFCSLAFLTRIQEHVLKSGHTWRSFWCSLTTPSGADFRARMFDEFWDANAERISGRLAVKDAWKAIVTPVLTGFFNTKWTGHEGLEINLTLENSDIDGRELEVLKKKFPHAFQEKRGSDGKVKRTVTRNALDKILSGMRAYDFNLLFPFPPLPLTKPSELVQITLVPCSVFIAGRYLKHSRSVSQTPWFIEEERKGDASVEELICTKLQAAFQAESFRFMASGREDIDVLMLGDGRPFAVELVGAKLAGLTELEMSYLENDINSTHKEIGVRYLTVVERSDMAIIKAGEEEKTKTYSALCSMREPVAPSDLAQLNGLSNIQILQHTPIRVLHRRANAQRPRTIHDFNAQPAADPHRFRLIIKTQAGTYVKEFIHGDLGRTEPSISALLGREVECDELDVMCVDLVWPPNQRRVDCLSVG